MAHSLSRRLDSSWVIAAVQIGFDFESSTGGCGPDELQDSFVAYQRFGGPVPTDLAEQSSLDWIVAIGLNMQGHKEALGLWTGKEGSNAEGAKFWLLVLTELNNRGVKDVFVVCVDGLTGFPDAIQTVFPKAEVQLCVVHMMRNSLNYASWKQRRAVAADLKPIYQASTVEEAELRLDEFSAKWDGTYPTISQMWRRNWENLKPFYAYPADIRKVIYTTNAVESLNMSLRRVIKTRGSFPNQESAFKLLYLALENVAKNWTMPVQDWKAALQRFSIMFGDRVPKPEMM